MSPFLARDEDTHEEGEIDDLNAEADIPIEELLKKFHPELYDGTDDKSNNSDNEQNSNQSLPESEPTPSTSSGIQRSQRRRKSQLSDNEVSCIIISKKCKIKIGGCTICPSNAKINVFKKHRVQPLCIYELNIFEKPF